jgi:glycosyltransferase involved in cell wall biosynthesis
MPFLTEALDSVVQQTYTNLEILCINDGSSDNTGEVLEKYAKMDSRIKVIHNPENLKLIKTLNKGVGLANGEYIARMDADDVCFPDRIEKQLHYLFENPEIDVVSTANIVIDENGNVIGKSTPRAKFYTTCMFSSFFYVPIGHPDVMGKTKVFKGNPYLENEIALHVEDYELWSRLLRKGYRLANMPDFLLYFRKNMNSVSNLYTDIQNVNFARCVQVHINEYFNKSISLDVIRVICNRIQGETLLKDFRRGVFKIKQLQKLFIEMEKPTKEEQQEIRDIVYTHLIDVLYQAFKRAGFKVKLFSLFVFIINVKIMFNKTSYKYLKEKFK